MTLKLLRYVKYLGPIFFLLGVIYTSLYPERKLLVKPKGASDSKVGKMVTPFDDGTTTAIAQEEIPLAKCRVWMEMSSIMATLPEKLLSCSVESALINLKNASSYSICLIYDRFSHHEETPPHWLQKLKKTYGEAVVEHTPEYASVFAGTLFEETYINSADLSFMAPAMIWALIWKHAGLLLSPDTLLLTNLKSYYNFVLLNVTANSSTTALTQFTDRHHELPGHILNHFMEHARRLKQIAREKEASSIRMGVPAIHDNVRLTLDELTDDEWTKEIEKYCGRAQLSKTLVKHLCQDTEIVSADLVPTYTFHTFKRLTKKNFKELLALRIHSVSDFELMTNHIPSLKMLKKICPVTFNNHK